MEIPNIMRGFFYPTTRVNRCPSYHSCAACRGCQNYSKYQFTCRVCESRKPAGLECSLERHPDYIQWCLKELTHKMNSPMFHPDKETGTVGVSTYQNNEYQKVLDSLSEFSRYGSVTPDK